MAIKSQMSVAATPYSTGEPQHDSDAFEGGGALLRGSFYTRAEGAPTERVHPTVNYSNPTAPRVWRPAAHTMKREHTGHVRPQPTPSELQTLVLQVLKDSYEGGETSGISTNAIRKHCSSEVSKLQLNQLLYLFKDSEQVDFTPGTPPLWRHKPPLGASAAAASVTPADDEPLVLVLCDLGCSHDCLQNLIPYAEKDMMEVRAYADLAFAGFGVKPPLNCKNVTVFHAKTADKNSADLQLIWDLSRYVQKLSIDQPRRGLQVYCSTKDLQFQSLKSLVEENPLHELTFCTNWETLRMHIE